VGQPNPWPTLCESLQPGQQWRCTQRPAVGTAHAHVYASVAAGLLRMRTPARLCNYRFRCELRAAAADNFAGQFSADYSELIRRVCTTGNYNASLGTAVLFNLCAAIFAIIQRLFAAVNTQSTMVAQGANLRPKTRHTSTTPHCFSRGVTPHYIENIYTHLYFTIFYGSTK